MKVTGPGQVNTPNVKRTEKKKAAERGEFGKALNAGETESAAASALSGTAPLAAVDAAPAAARENA